ncbi:NADPH-cytochrome P450 reductase [Fusarium phyllophilum]|uniref:NADPH--hemoprotein reductase n=1 Tax=Fusarium phyllophilum TaxID=47803 RepID=A0A8H5I3A4_9HYPO|nr:NADPH-cytochrome P450 reductase [Fusarium phyllophilum]
MVADLEDYDFDTLDTSPSSKIAIFVLATYGDGEPTDNAIAFFNVITEDTASFSLGEQEKPLNNMRYAAFGLGDRTDEHFNPMVRKSTRALSCLGAQNLTAIGEGDDGMGTREEDFLAWKEVMWSDVASAYRIMEKRQVFQPLYEVLECKIVQPTSKPYLGELGNESTMSGLHNHQIARIVESRELFFAGDRKCLHLELDLTCSGLTYKTGDHVAIWLMNSSEEVDALFDVLNLAYAWLLCVSTNYLLAIKAAHNKESYHLERNYTINGPRGKYIGFRMPFHIRTSTFRLPKDSTTPIIMVGPGTGVAPFRAFIQERAQILSEGATKVGRMLLFFGCRHSQEDVMYKEEWKAWTNQLQDTFELVTAFSRETSHKVYVQQRLKEYANTVNDLLLRGAMIYLCADATRMAREVQTVLAEIVSEQPKISSVQGEAVINKMREDHSYQEDVWE